MGVDADKSVDADVIAMEPVGTPPPPSGEVSDSEYSQILRQTRTRRLFSTAQLYSFTLVYMGTWIAVAENIYYAIQNGGPRGWLFGFIICIFGTMCQVVSVAEIAALQPIAGAQYYWTYEFAAPSMKKFLTWIQGWVTWLGYVAMFASLANINTVSINGLIALGHEAAGVEEPWAPEGWQTTLIVIAYVVVVTLVNLYAFRIIPWVELMAGIANVLLFFTVLIILWVMAPRNGVEIFLQPDDGSSGWGDFVSFNIGTLSSISLFMGFEGTVHLGEETRNPKRAVPSAIFWGVLSNIGMGFVMIFTYGIAMPSPDVILDSVSPLAAILRHATGSTRAAMAILSLITLSSFGCLLGTLTSVSRLTWAWARDGGLPSHFAIVDAKTRVPLRAVYGTAFLVCLLALLNLNDRAFIALGAILSLSSLSLYCSYAIVFACIIFARFTTGIPRGEWHAGKFSMPCNIAAMIYTVYMMIWLPFPAVLPVTAEDMNYAGPVFGSVVIGAISWWFIWAKDGWAGPNLKVVEMVLQSHDDSK